jgi:hypothetical protein
MTDVGHMQVVDELIDAAVTMYKSDPGIAISTVALSLRIMFIRRGYDPATLQHMLSLMIAEEAHDLHQERPCRQQ